MKTKHYTGLIGMSIVLALVMGGLTTAVAQEGVVLGNGVVMTAEIVGIDRVDRTLDLRGPEGGVVMVEVSHSARNFDQIEVGDQVKVEYYESVALYLGQRGQKPKVAGGMVSARSPKGDKPEGLAVEAIDVSAKVAAIDKKNRSVTLELANGKKVTSRVDQSVEAFDKLKKGDLIHACITEAIAISVEKP
jgi:hypothetical protein